MGVADIFDTPPELAHDQRTPWERPRRRRHAGTTRPRWQFVHNFVVGFMTIAAAIVVTVSYAAPTTVQAADAEAELLGMYRMQASPAYRELLREAVEDKLLGEGAAGTTGASIDAEIARLADIEGARAGLDAYLALVLFEATFEQRRTPAQDAWYTEFQQYFGQSNLDIARRTLEAWNAYADPLVPSPQYGPCCTLNVLSDTGPEFSGFTPPSNAIGIGQAGYTALDGFLGSVGAQLIPEVAAFLELIERESSAGDNSATVLTAAGFSSASLTLLYATVGVAHIATAAANAATVIGGLQASAAIAAGAQAAQATATAAAAVTPAAAAGGAAVSTAAAFLIVLPVLIGGGMKMADVIQREQFVAGLEAAVANPDFAPDFNEIVGRKTEELAGLWYTPCDPGYDPVVTDCYSTSCPAGHSVVGLFCERAADSISKPTQINTGVVADQCPAGTVFETGLCYAPCPPGTTSDGALFCYTNCPPGYDTISLLDCSRPIGSSCPDGFIETAFLCGRPRETRPAGTIPDACAPGFTRLDLLCYAPCPAGYDLAVGFCIQNDCPAGYDNLALTCFRPFSSVGRESYHRGAGSVNSPSSETVIANQMVIFNFLLKRIIADPADYGPGTSVQPWWLIVTPETAPPSDVETIPAPPQVQLSGTGGVEGAAISLSYQFVDTNVGDTHTATIDWGDGSPVAAVNPLANPGTLTHTYADEGNYTATLVLTDQTDRSGTSTLPIAITNATPAVTASATTPNAFEGQTASVNAGFSDAGTGDTHTASVDWGDGPGPMSVSTGSLATLSHVYANEGEYTVTVRVSDNDGATGVATTTVSVSDVPPAVTLNPFAAIDEGGLATSSATFTDPGLIDAHNATVDWGEGNGFELWGFGLANLQHQYRQNGTYTVTLRVNDTRGPFGEAAQTVTVRNVAPTVQGSASPILEGGTATINASIIDPGVDDTFTATVAWRDGASPVTVPASQLGALTNVYPDNGEFTATVTVTDSDGAVGSTRIPISVANVNPVVTVVGDQIDEGETATVTAFFVDPGVDDLHTATIDWGEGNGPEALPGLQLPDVDHVYSSPGNYTVTVAVTDSDGGVGTGSSTVSVGAIAPVVTADGDQITEGGTATVAASFTDAGSATSHTATVDWGDGAGPVSVDVADLASLTHTYVDDGTYTVTVTVTSSNNATGTASTTVTVANAAPVVTVAGDSIDEADTATVVASFVDPGLDDTHTASVDWGDGAGPEAVDLTDLGSLMHIYADDGSYTVTVTVTDDDALAGSSTATVEVADVAPVVTVAGDSIEEAGTATIIASFTDPGDDTHSASVDWGDGTPVEAVDPAELGSLTHAYPDDGTYTVTVTVTDDAGPAGSSTADVVVANVAPVATATGDTIDEGGVATIVGGVTDVGVLDTHTVTVDWGEGNDPEPFDIGSLGGLNHTYVDEGTYTVTVTVTDNAGDSGSATTTVEVANVVPALSAPDVSVDEGAEVTVRVQTDDPGGDDQFAATVDWGDGDGEETVDPTSLGELKHTYGDDGTFTVTVTLTELERVDSVAISAALSTLVDRFVAARQIADRSSSVSFTVTVSSVAPQVTVSAATEADPGTAQVSIDIDDGAGDTHTATVDWGDGAGPVPVAPADLDALEHTYTVDGTYTVTVVVTDDDGEVTTTTTTVVVTGASAQTADPTTPTTSSPDSPVPDTPAPGGADGDDTSADAPATPTTDLPATGAQGLDVVQLALVLLLAGLGIVLSTRRRGFAAHSIDGRE